MKYDLELARLRQPQITAHAEASPIQTATLTSNVAITIEHTIKQIDEIPESSLTDTDKDIS